MDILSCLRYDVTLDQIFMIFMNGYFEEQNCPDMNVDMYLIP